MNKLEVVPSETVAAVAGWVKASGPRSLHYFGCADRGLIQALRAVPHLEFRMTDYYNRWGCETLFHFGDELDESEREKFRRPEWLEGVPVYMEGIPPVDLLLLDLPPKAIPNLAREVTSKAAILLGAARQLPRSGPHATRRHELFDVIQLDEESVSDT